VGSAVILPLVRERSKERSTRFESNGRRAEARRRFRKPAIVTGRIRTESSPSARSVYNKKSLSLEDAGEVTVVGKQDAVDAQMGTSPIHHHGQRFLLYLPTVLDIDFDQLVSLCRIIKYRELEG
jgi:hypothetical protein